MRELKLRGGSSSSTHELAEMEKSAGQKYLATILSLGAFMRQFGELINNLKNEFIRGQYNYTYMVIEV